MSDHSLKLIAETASWNGRLSAAIEIALIDIRHANLEGGVEMLTKILAEYETYRNEQLVKLLAWSKQNETTPE